MNEEIFELKLKGYCCSQIIMELGLRRLEKENPDLIAAMAGLCNGIWLGQTCGVISAAICLFYLADPQQAERYSGDLSDWFDATFGSLTCDELIGENPLSKSEKCPMMLDATFKKLSEILEWDI